MTPRWLLALAACGALPDGRYPIFFLGDVVLLPGEALPLQIFEPRYRLLVARCLGDYATADSLGAAAFVGDADPCAFAPPSANINQC